MNTHKLALIVIALILYGASLPAQKASFSHAYTHYGVREGLVHEQVMCGFQDSFGYLWFGTKGGISRFDGKAFHNYRSGIEIAGEGQVHYIGQYKDIVYAVLGRFILFFYPDGIIEKIDSPDGYSFAQHNILPYDDKLYLFNSYEYTPSFTDFAEHHYVVFDFITKKFRISDKVLPHIFAVTSIDGMLIALSANNIWHIVEDEPVSLKPFGRYAHHRYPMTTKEGEVFVKEIPDESNSEMNLYRIHKDSTGWKEEFILNSKLSYMYKIIRLTDSTYFCAENANYSAFILKNKIPQPFSPKTLLITDSFTDRDNNLWLCTEEGVFNCYDLSFETFSLNFGRSDFVWDLRKDVLGDIWVSCYGMGFFRIDKKLNISKAPTLKDTKHAYMNSAEDARHRLYLNSAHGVEIFDPRRPNGPMRHVGQGVSMASYYDSVTNTVFTGGAIDGQFMVNAIDSALNVKSYSFVLGYPISICRDGQGCIRIGTHRGGAYLDDKKEQIVVDTIGKPYQQIQSMCLDKQDVLWLATFQGLYAEYKDGSIRQIMPGRFRFVADYREKYIIFGSADGILYILDLEAFHSSEAIHVRSFDRYQGYDALMSRQNGSHIDSEGYVWTMGGDKVLRFRPDELMKKKLPIAGTPFIGAVYFADKNQEWIKASPEREIVLHPDQNNLRIDILQASVSAPNRLRFRYRLEGYSDSWLETTERTIIFQNLPYSVFRLEVQSSIDGQNWSDSVYSSPVTISKPFIFTTSGLLLMALALILLVVSVVYLSVKWWNRRREREHQMDKLRNRAVKSKYIPHFTGNVLNSINYLIEKDKHLAQVYISEFASFNRQTLLNAEKLSRSLADELEYTERYLKLEKLRFEDKLEYTIRVEEDIDMKTLIPVMILHTFCENAIKHGFRHKEGTGNLKMEVYVEDGFLVLAVEDDGIGRTAAREKNTAGTGEGLAIIKQQIRLFNKYNKKDAFMTITDLYDDDEQARGTRFEFHMPQGFIIYS